MTIALTAPNGNIGTALRKAAKVPIRALARNPGADAVRFDFADPSTHAPALAGVDTLILVAPSGREQEARDLAVVAAAKAAGVAHVVKLSGAGVDEAGTRFGAHHLAVEKEIRASGMGWTSIRPTFFMENMRMLGAAIAAGTYPAPIGDARFTQVAVADIADVLLAVAIAPAQHRNAIYTLTGPTADSGKEIAATLSEATGRLVTFVAVPEEAFRENLARAGLDPWTVDGVAEGFRKIRAGGAAEVTDHVRKVTGHAPIDFKTWARSVFQPVA